MNSEETSVIQQSVAAERNKEDILQAQANIRANFLVLARLLKENRDMSLWKLLDYESFEAFLGDPEIGFRRSKAYDLIRIYELYIERLKLPPEVIISIGNTKLLKIAGVVESDTEGWLNKAKVLSVSDLKLELAGGEGAASPNYLPNKCAPPPADDSCCVCGRTPVDRHHFPVGRTSSSGETGDWTIPLCRECHSLYHQEPKDWMWTYRKNWARHLYSVIDELRKKLG